MDPVGVKTEIVKDVPVKRQALDNSPAPSVAQTSNNPISSANRAALAGNFNEDAELDNILKDVNHQVKAEVDPAKKSKVASILSGQAANLQKNKKLGSKPKKSGLGLVIAVAIIAAALLIAAAVYTFLQSQNSSKLAKAHLAAVEQAKTQTPQTSPVTFDANYLDSFNKSLASDSSQDFDASSLSDSALGL